MKIGIISDLHIAYDKAREIAEFKNRALKSILGELDCLVMCGDNAEPNSDLSNHKRLFDTIRSRSDLLSAFITGNHELIGHVFRKGVTSEEIKERFNPYSLLAEDYDLIHLEDRNLAIDGITISGTYGHYDGTLGGPKLKEDAKTVSKLANALEQRAATDGRKILITHSVPTKAMIGRPDGPIQDQYTPFAGSLRLEKAIRKIRPDLHFCGHTHSYAHSKIGGTETFNVGTDCNDFFYFVVDTSDLSVVRSEKRLNRY